MNVATFWSEGWTAALVNHLWQSTVFVGAAWLLAWALRKNHARVRYCVWMAASVEFLLPFSLLIAAGEWLRSLIPAPVARPAIAAAMEQITQPFAQTEFFGATTAPVAAHHVSLLPVLLMAVWVCGALVVVGQFARGWWRVHAAKRAAVITNNRRSFVAGAPQDDNGTKLLDSGRGPLKLAADVPVLETRGMLEPGIFGIVRPVLLLPEGILERLTAEQVRAIVAHEMCHVRRRDNLTFAIHMIVEALFWFHPAVWWIGARLIEERERACDEAVVEASGEAQTYAEGILNVCKFYVESPVGCVAGVTGADLKKRIVRIMAKQMGRGLGLSRKLLLGAVGSAALAAPLIAGFSLAGWSLAQSRADDAVANPPRFEVASIKPSEPDDQSYNLNSRGGLVSIENYSVRRLIRTAYGLKSDSQVIGGPNWLDRRAFDIEAKFDDREAAKLPDLSDQERFREYRLALQSLLADRFQLKLHLDVRSFPIYALVVMKGGAKMKTSPQELDGNGKPKAGREHSLHGSNGHVTATAISMGGFADWLTLYAGSDRVVLDRTGLTGDYDFKLNWIEDNGRGAAADAQIPDLFTALQEQLGLRLEPAKGPVEVLVIDHVEQPSPN